MKKPSLTELVSLLDKPALLNWANKQGLKGVDISKERQKWLDDGTSLHSQVENFIKNKTPFICAEHQVNFEKFICNKEVVGCECGIETKWFTGRYDLKIKSDNKLVLIDFKRNQKRIYFENALQLVGYSMCEKCDLLSIVSVPDFKELPVIIQDRKPFEEILKALSVIYYHKKTIENGTY